MSQAIGDDGMNWLSGAISDFIAEAKEAVEYSHGVLNVLKANMGKVQEALDGWSEPMLTRGPKPVTMEDFEREQKPVRVAKNALIKEGSHDILAFMKESNHVLNVSTGHPDWKAYVDFINDLVVEGVCNTVRLSLAYLLEQIDPAIIAKDEKPPLLEVTLALKNNKVEFKPVLSHGNGKGVRDSVDNWVNNFFLSVNLCKRLDTDGNFIRELHQDPQIQALLATVNTTLTDTESKCYDLREQCNSYSDLWLQDLDAEFKTFLKEALNTTELGIQMPDLAKFDEEIQKFTATEAGIEEMPSMTDIGWIKVDAGPVKSNLHTQVRRWVYKYTSYLQDDLTSKLSELNTFMGEMLDGLAAEVIEGDDDALRASMKCIRGVQRRADATREMFEPLNQTVKLLKREKMEVDTITVADMDLQEYLEAVPMKWDRVVNTTFKKKEEILPLQTAAVETIKEELEQFFLEMRQFRNDFRANAPFKYGGTVEEAYAIMEKYAAQCGDKRAQVQMWNATEDLFELAVSKYPETADTANELKLLKMLWDMKQVIMCTFEDWRRSLWSSVDTEALEDATKLFSC
jgi:dynein heavy chain